MKSQSSIGKPIICEEISIDSSLNITQQLKKQSHNDSIEIDIRKELIKIEQQKNSGASVQFAIPTNSYSIIQEQEEDLLDQLDYLLDSHHQGTINVNRANIQKCTNKVDKDYRIYQKFEKVLNTTYQSMTRIKTDSELKTEAKVKTDSLIEELHQTSIMEFNRQLQDLQSLIKDYRNELKYYQGQLQQKALDQYEEKQWLKNNIDQLIIKLQKSESTKIEQQREMNYLIEQNTEIIQQNKELKNQINKLTRSSSISKSRASHVVSMKTKFKLNQLNNNRNLMDEETQYFTQAIREQLQNMVESLVIQVQHLRSVNDRLKDQIKNLNKQLVEAEKVLKRKNQKLYNLQMCMLNRRKQTLAVPLKLSRFLKNQPIVNSHASEAVSEKPRIKFSLADLINNKRQVNNIERLMIGFKIIQCYQQKITGNDFEMLMAQDLTIEYNRGQAKTIQISTYGMRGSKITSERLSRQKKQSLIDNVIWNLNYMLDELFRIDTTENSVNFNNPQEDLRQKIQNIFEDNQGKKLQYIEQIKQIIISLLKKYNNF